MANVAAAAAPTVAVGREEETAAIAADSTSKTTDLHSLAAAGDRDAVLELLDGGMVDAEELNRRDSDGLTPLHSAIQGCMQTLFILCKLDMMGRI